MVYEVTVTIDNSPTKIKSWGYLIKSSCEVNAKIEALNRAKIEATKQHSRYKKCTFTVKSGDCVVRPDL